MHNRKPSVWFLTQGYTVAGGHEAHVLHFATVMRDQGFDTRIVVVEELPTEPHRFMRSAQARKIPLVSIGDFIHGTADFLTAMLYIPWAVYMWLRKAGQPGWSRLRRYIMERQGPRWLATEIRRQTPAVIHVHGRLPESYWAKLPAVSTVVYHGTEGKRDSTWDDAEASAFRDFCNGCAANIAPGTAIAEHLKSDFGISAKIEQVYTICPDQPGARELAETPSRFTGVDTRFGILCRMTPEKGIDTLLAALLDMRDTLGDVRFAFIGNGALADDVEAFSAKHAFAHVTLMRSFENVVDALQDVDVFVHPSISDAMPLAVVEALMCGKPCIVTRVGGLPDLVRDGREGRVIPPRDASALSAAMLAFARMPLAERHAFAERARARYAAVCCEDAVASRLTEIYQRVLNMEPQ